MSKKRQGAFTEKTTFQKLDFLLDYANDLSERLYSESLPEPKQRQIKLVIGRIYLTIENIVLSEAKGKKDA